MDALSIENSFEQGSAFIKEIIWLNIKEDQGARNTREKLNVDWNKLGLS